jgi:uncharacterized protein YdeI (YjbR/CyaY-like superfamily)
MLCSWSVLVTEDAVDADADTRRVRRELHEMPEDVRAALEKKKLMEHYKARPPYQQNDYVGWIGRSKLPATRAKRLQQMLDELERGGVYMHMAWHG